MKAFVAILSVLAMATISEAIFAENLVLSATAGPSLALAGGSAGVVSTAAVIGGGALLLKAGALAALYLASRQKRSAEENEQKEDFTFSYLAATEVQGCTRRLICDLATGEMGETENDVILTLFGGDVEPASPKFDFNIAAKIGKDLKNVQACELRFACPLTGSQINKLF